MLIKYAPATVELGLACLRLLMQSAVEWHYLRVSPMVGVKRPRKQRQEMRPLMPAQLQQLLESVKDPQWRALILLTVTGGLRLGEVAGARWQHLDLRSRTYFVRESLVQRAQVKELRQPKSAQSQAKVLLSPACGEALREHRRCQVERRLAVAGYEDQGFIFAKPDGRYWEARMLHSVWSKMLRDAGLPHFRFHDLRHTCAALLIDHGAHPKLVQQQLRHSSIRTTLDVYGHLFPQRVDEAVAGLDIALGLAPAPATPQRASK
jgi:integrase